MIRVIFQIMMQQFRFNVYSIIWFFRCYIRVAFFCLFVYVFVVVVLRTVAHVKHCVVAAIQFNMRNSRMFKWANERDPYIKIKREGQKRTSIHRIICMSFYFTFRKLFVYRTLACMCVCVCIFVHVTTLNNSQHCFLLSIPCALLFIRITHT